MGVIDGVEKGTEGEAVGQARMGKNASYILIQVFNSRTDR